MTKSIGINGMWCTNTGELTCEETRDIVNPTLPVSANLACENSGDGECDDDGVSRIKEHQLEAHACSWGTDCEDCGPRENMIRETAWRYLRIVFQYKYERILYVIIIESWLRITAVLQAWSVKPTLVRWLDLLRKVAEVGAFASVCCTGLLQCVWDVQKLIDLVILSVFWSRERLHLCDYSSTWIRYFTDDVSLMRCILFWRNIPNTIYYVCISLRDKLSLY